MLGEIVTWVFEKVLGRAERRRTQPEFDVVDVGRHASNMVSATNVWVNVELTIENVGRGAADSYRVEIRVTRRDGVHLSLMNPRDPGDATMRQEASEDVIEWQSALRLPQHHHRSVVGKLHMQQVLRVPVSVVLRPSLWHEDQAPRSRRHLAYGSGSSNQTGRRGAVHWLACAAWSPDAPRARAHREPAVWSHLPERQLSSPIHPEYPPSR